MRRKAVFLFSKKNYGFGDAKVSLGISMGRWFELCEGRERNGASLKSVA
jgi:hypothetical protein